MRVTGAVALVLAAGKSERMPGDMDKLMLHVGGRPVLAYCLEAFDRSRVVDAVVLVCNPVQRKRYQRFVQSMKLSVPLILVDGGSHRQLSVYNGLRAVPEQARYVLIHDGARCCVTPEIIQRCYEGVCDYGACIAGMPVKDTIKVVGPDGAIVSTPERSKVWMAQTPQCFCKDEILQAYGQAIQAGFWGTDDAMVYERTGRTVTMIEGDYTNIKLTTHDDIQQVQSVLMGRVADAPRLRVGYGYDVHELVGGRALVLGGVRIDHERGLDGHSDADVLTHAVMDALLGALALGDIGKHFPPNDPAYKNADSLKLLEHVGRLVESAGYSISNVDVTVCAQRPMLAPHIPAMREQLAAALNVFKSCISIKATTSEGLGFEGEEQGISARAVALLQALRV